MNSDISVRELFDYVNRLLPSSRIEEIDELAEKDEELAAKLVFMQWLSSIEEETAELIAPMAEPKIRRSWSWRRRVAAIAIAASLLISVFYVSGFTTGPTIVARIDDGPNTLEVYDNGGVSGADSFSSDIQGKVLQLLKRRSVGTPSTLRDLRAGTRSGDVGYHGLQSPLDVNVLSIRPVLRWDNVNTAEAYFVFVRDVDSNETIESDAVTGTEWQCTDELESGTTYEWGVKTDNELYAPASPPYPRFRIICEEERESLNAAIAQASGSHLARGIIYLDAGLVDQAEVEFDALRRRNPESAEIRDIVASISQLQRRTE